MYSTQMDCFYAETLQIMWLILLALSDSVFILNRAWERRSKGQIQLKEQVCTEHKILVELFNPSAAGFQVDILSRESRSVMSEVTHAKKTQEMRII